MIEHLAATVVGGVAGLIAGILVMLPIWLYERRRE